MAKGFDFLKVKSAVKRRNKLDLSFTHLTTMDFGEIVPLCAKELVPSDEFNVNANYFSRMSPLARPTYGKFSFKTVAGFVPYHQIADDAEAWLAGKTSWEGDTPKHRFFQMRTLVNFIITTCMQNDGTADNCDFCVIDSEGETVYYRFTDVGQYYVKVLNALGYAMPEGVSLVTASDWDDNVGSVRLSAYPLLAFFKLYNDYMSQSQRYNTSQLSYFLKCVKHNVAVDGYSTTGEIGLLGIVGLFQQLFLNYDNDYFTSAWQTPNRPISTNESIVGATVPGTDLMGISEYVTNDSDGNYVGNSSVSTSGDFMLSQRALNFLKSFDDWVRRNNYSGSRAVQQVYSRFGIKTSDYRSNYAEVITTDTMPVQVGDVTATSDTSGAALGEYAGKGIMNGGKNFFYRANDYGLLVILGYFTVVPMNGYGFDRMVLRNSPLDYYNPEFDGIGADAISAGEYYCDPSINPANDTSLDTDVFGYTERYNSYRFGRDLITGEFRARPDSDMNVWHTGRLLSDIRKSGELVAQSTAVNTLAQYDSEYNRIFSVTDSYVDHFYLTCQFGISAVRPMMSLNQVVDLGEGDTTVPRNGNVIS